MATTAAVLEIAVRANTRQASSGLRSMNTQLDKTAKTSRTATASTDRLSKSNRTLGGTMKGAVKYAVGLGAAYVGLQAAKEAVSATTDLAKSTLTLKKGFGLTIATASELGAVLKARGADASSVGMAFNTLSRQVVAAKDGSASAVKSFKELGITQKELKTTSPDQQLRMIADGMQSAGKGADRAAAASALFGRGWKTVVPVLREGSGELQNQLDLANKYGAAFGGKSIKSIKDLIATERELKIAQLGLQVQFTEKIAPALIKIGLAIAGAVYWFEKLSPSIKLAAAAVATFAGAIWLAVKAQAAFDAVAAANPYVLLAAAVAVAAVLIITHWKQIKKAVGDAFEFIKKHALLIGLALAPFTLGMSLLAAVVYKNWDKIKGAFKAGFEVVRKLGSVFAAAKGAAVDAFGAVRSVVVDAGKAIIGVLAKIVRVVASVIQAFQDLQSAPGKLLDKGTGALKDLGGAGLNALGFQKGGVLVSGSGSGDRVPAMLEPGEVVWNREAVRTMGGPQKANAVNSMVPRFASGGAVGGAMGKVGGMATGLASAAGIELLKVIAKHAGGAGNAQAMLKEAQRMNALHQPYLWGGGHSGFSRNGPWDCSGAVSQVLHGAGLPLASPMVSGGFMNYGQPGLGQGGKTGIWANPEHVWMTINGQGFSTSHENPGGGWGDVSYSSRPGFVQRHPELAAKAAGLGPNNKKGQPLSKKAQRGGIIGLASGGKISPHSPGAPKIGSKWLKGVGSNWSPDEIFTALRQLGAPKDMAGFLSAVSVGESSGNPRAIGHDPGGSTGYGLLQITSPFNSDIIRKYGGTGAMLNPWENMLAGMDVYRRQGPGAWYGHQGSRGRLLLDAISGGAKVPKTKKTKGKSKKANGSGPNIDTSGVDAISETYAGLLDQYAGRMGSVNDITAAQNLLALQGYQVGASQNPLLGLKSPGAPVLGSMRSLMPDSQTALSFLQQANPPPVRTSASGRPGNYDTASPAYDTHVHIHGKKKGMSLADLIDVRIEKKQRKTARKGNRSLPSGRH